MARNEKKQTETLSYFTHKVTSDISPKVHYIIQLNNYCSTVNEKHLLSAFDDKHGVHCLLGQVVMKIYNIRARRDSCRAAS